MQEPVMIVCHGGIFHVLQEFYKTPYVSIKNCTLYLFEPDLDHVAIPWRIWMFEKDGNGLIKKTGADVPFAD